LPWCDDGTDIAIQHEWISLWLNPKTVDKVMTDMQELRKDNMEGNVSTDVQELRKEVNDLKTAQAVQAATQAGEMATQAATQAGAIATQAATQAGGIATMGAAQAGTVGALISGAAGLVVGLFLGLLIRSGDADHR
jgi:hypothetical protein